MKYRTLRRLAPSTLALSILTGCSSTPESAPASTSDDLGQIVPPGKSDNFLSSTAQEYMIEGQTTVTIESSLANATAEQKLERARQLVSLKHVVIGWFLNQYLADKTSHDLNQGYGGFSALTKNGSYEDLGIEPVDATTFRFTFRQEVAGKLDLLESLPTIVQQDGSRTFDLIVGIISNRDMAQLQTGNEWYRQSPWASFDPDRVTPDRLETMKLKIWPEPRSVDAYFDYEKLFADGKLTVAVHFGWDYLQDYHLKHSASTYKWLVETEHFTSPVSSYEKYTRNSGPLTKTIRANGKDVVVEVSLYWGKVGTQSDPDTDAGGRVLEQDLRDSFATREVIMFYGHAGPFYGFTMANWNMTSEGDLDDAEIPSLRMPEDMYQVVFTEGCSSYGVGQAFALNPNKKRLRNIDVTTLTNFGSASSNISVMDSLSAIFTTDVTGRHIPKTFMSWILDMETNTYWLNAMYGVHGIDDNPHRHPYASDKLCQSCRSDADCGGVGNKCTRLNSDEVICTYYCTSNDGCPDGYQCVDISVSGMMSAMVCAPSSLTCKTGPDEDLPKVLFNELYVEPLEGNDSSDTNGDGRVHVSEDEFVEIVNSDNHEIDLSGWTLADSTMTRHIFAEGTRLPAGKALVVFGGGDPASYGELGGAPVCIASHELGLSNDGDLLMLLNPAGAIVTEVTYDFDAAFGASMVRDRDGDVGSDWGLRDTPTPGTHSDGSSF